MEGGLVLDGAGDGGAATPWRREDDDGATIDRLRRGPSAVCGVAFRPDAGVVGVGVGPPREARPFDDVLIFLRKKKIDSSMNF